MTATTLDDVAAPLERAAARRTFALISHPDAGKTSLTDHPRITVDTIGNT